MGLSSKVILIKAPDLSKNPLRFKYRLQAFVLVKRYPRVAGNFLMDFLGNGRSLAGV